MQLWNRVDGVIDPKADVGVYNRDRQVGMSFALKIICNVVYKKLEEKKIIYDSYSCCIKKIIVKKNPKYIKNKISTLLKMMAIESKRDLYEFVRLINTNEWKLLSIFWLLKLFIIFI